MVIFSISENVSTKTKWILEDGMMKASPKLQERERAEAVAAVLGRNN